MIYILYALEIIVGFFVVYQSTISVSGMARKIKYKRQAIIEPYNRFAVIVCAHNEENVIGQIVASLRQLDYPKALHDIIVLADNCTDNTADEASKGRQFGDNLKVWERFDAKKSKGFALEWAFEMIMSLEGTKMAYDAVIVFDADNLVSKNFLTEMDRGMQSGAEVLQGYLDSKNGADTWISKSYAVSYWATNRVFQLARESLGLSAQLGGTGMCISTKVLKEHAWGTDSLTEDLEYAARYVLSSGKPVRWMHQAKIYDEKPLKLKPSMIQRTRWSRGHFQCAAKYTIPLLKNAVWHLRNRQWTKSLMSFDVAVYLVQPSRIVLTTLMMLFSIAGQFTATPIVKHSLLWSGLLSVYYTLPLIGLIREKQGRRWTWLVIAFAFAYTWVPIIIHALFTLKNKTWNKTVHTRAVAHEEVEQGVSK